MYRMRQRGGDVKHFLMRCKALNRERKELMEKKKKVVTGLDEVEEERNERNVAWILDLECRNETIARGEIVDSEICAEVRDDLAYAHTKCHPHHLTLTQTHMFVI